MKRYLTLLLLFLICYQSVFSQNDTIKPSSRILEIFENNRRLGVPGKLNPGTKLTIRGKIGFDNRIPVACRNSDIVVEGVTVEVFKKFEFHTNFRSREFLPSNSYREGDFWLTDNGRSVKDGYSEKKVATANVKPDSTFEVSFSSEKLLDNNAPTELHYDRPLLLEKIERDRISGHLVLVTYDVYAVTTKYKVDVIGFYWPCFSNMNDINGDNRYSHLEQITFSLGDTNRNTGLIMLTLFYIDG